MQQPHEQQQTETPSRASRLPVNPRRHKVAPEQRKRVATACNVRRIKCSGEKPCRQCRSSSRDCVYPTVIEKVAVARNELEDLRRRCEAAERVLQIKVPDAAERRQLLQQELDNTTSSRAGSSSSFTPPQQHQQPVPQPQPQPQHAQSWRPDPSGSDAEASPANDGRMLSDPDGNARFLGETSGATFLDCLKEFMSTVFPLAYNRPWLSPTPNNGSTFLASLGRYQTYDSRPVYEDTNVDPLVLPSRRDMSVMLNDLRFFIQDGSGTFPCGGIYWWGDLGSVPVDPNPGSFPAGASRQDVLDKYRHLAFYHTAFAVACQANTTAARMPDPADLSQVYFARARRLLGNPLDITSWTISDVAVLALMGFYLIEMNRRDAAYMYVSNAMHIAMMHGAHRGWLDERGKRVFWTLYILDRWLSCLMGRPPTISEDAVRLPLPCDAPSLPPAAGLRAHVELARISGHIVCNTYRVAPYDHHPAGAARHVERALQMLETWLSSLPPTLQLTVNGASTDPACCLLHMNYNQLLVLLVRPIFFVAVKKAFAERYVALERHWNIEHHSPRIRACSDAARRNLYLARWLLKLSGSRKLLQAGLHHVFNAAIILMLEELLPQHQPQPQPQAPPLSPSAESDDVAFAIGVFDEESKTGSNYARDCATVLKDLRSLIQRLRHAPPGIVPVRVGGPSSSTPGLSTPEDVTLGARSTSSTPTTTGPREYHPHHHHHHQHQHQHHLHQPHQHHQQQPPLQLQQQQQQQQQQPQQQQQQQAFAPSPGLHFQVNEGDAIYQELAMWADNTDLQLYSNNYLI
ncbi:putative transcriptional regulatory protein [Colletotrichum sidae]|uniref:Putative transcriptional regulatory protein n=1 Tax=Colletotrichum sidae TaxID=1347389 RepID=A0A4R8TN34_9PEZI|nr:putative transcriptional regulatory protein [Colletotrichum sidae]